jgi:hypothetical protein
METTKVIRSLLERKQTSTPLRIRFLLESFRNATFAPIAQAAIQCPFPVTLAFHTCTFDAESTGAFESMFAGSKSSPKSGLRSLELGHVTFTKSSDEMIRTTVLGRESCLESLSLSYGQGTGALVAATMDALKTNTKLESLHVETIHGETLVNLLDGLPSVCNLKMLSCNYLFLPNSDSSRMLQAFQRNLSVHEFAWQRGNMSPVDEHKLRSIVDRNEFLQDRLLNNPELIPASIWPNALTLTNQMEYGKDILFQGLRCLVDTIEQETRSSDISRRMALF